MWIRKRLYQCVLPLAVLMGLLFSFCPLQAATNQKLSGFMPFWGGVVDSQISPDSSRVVYRADQEADGLVELFSVPISGPTGPVIKVNGPLATGGNAGLFQISRDSGRVIYMADQDTNDFLELYMTSNYSIHLPLILNGGTLI